MFRAPTCALQTLDASAEPVRVRMTLSAWKTEMTKDANIAEDAKNHKLYEYEQYQPASMKPNACATVLCPRGALPSEAFCVECLEENPFGLYETKPLVDAMDFMGVIRDDPRFATKCSVYACEAVCSTLMCDDCFSKQVGEMIDCSQE